MNQIFFKFVFFYCFVSSVFANCYMQSNGLLYCNHANSTIPMLPTPGYYSTEQNPYSGQVLSTLGHTAINIGSAGVSGAKAALSAPTWVGPYFYGSQAVNSAYKAGQNAYRAEVAIQNYSSWNAPAPTWVPAHTPFTPITSNSSRVYNSSNFVSSRQPSRR